MIFNKYIEPIEIKTEYKILNGVKYANKKLIKPIQIKLEIR